MILWCCYPHRPDLSNVPRWKCDTCGNHVGTHHKTDNPTRPLGNIPSPALKTARIHIHALIDPAWKSGKVRRRSIYAHLSSIIGREYHTAEIKTVEEARVIYTAARNFLNASATTDSPTTGEGVTS